MAVNHVLYSWERNKGKYAVFATIVVWSTWFFYSIRMLYLESGTCVFDNHFKIINIEY